MLANREPEMMDISNPNHMQADRRPLRSEETTRLPGLPDVDAHNRA